MAARTGAGLLKPLEEVMTGDAWRGLQGDRVGEDGRWSGGQGRQVEWGEDGSDWGCDNLRASFSLCRRVLFPRLRFRLAVSSCLPLSGYCVSKAKMKTIVLDSEWKWSRES
jgi:hypothetical protein